MAARSFMTDDDPAPTVETIKSTLKIYPYAPGAAGTSIATLLEGGDVKPAPLASVPETVFVEGSGKAFNTVPPSDFGFFELMNEAVQNEPAGSTNAELMGQLAAIGIVKGQPFEPDERMRRILEDAAAVGNATSRALVFNPRASEEWAYYDGSAWFTMLWAGGYTFETPPPLVTKEGIKPFPATGVRKQHSRTSFLYAATVISPAMCMRLTGIGSQYLIAAKDADGNHFDGAQTYRVTLPPDIPAARFWSLTALRQRDALDAPDAAALPARRQPVLSDTGGDRERRRLDDHHVRPGQARTTLRRATGSRRRRARAGSCSCASTARSSRSSTSPGARARSRS